MAKMREWWQNVYVRDGVTEIRNRKAFMHADRETAEKQGTGVYGCLSPDIAFRIHVRLKPEGAPKRYADGWERRLWERYPNAMRQGTLP